MREDVYCCDLPISAFAEHPSYALLTPPNCALCGATCHCEGYNAHGLVYSCPTCATLHLEPLPFEPLFAQDPLQAALKTHYEIACPYCEARARLVGGDAKAGYFFICEDHCWPHFIRRF